MPRASLLVLFTVAGAASAAKVELEARFTDTVRPFLNSYCAGCHAGEKAPAQLDLTRYSSVAAVAQDYSRWSRVAQKLSAKEMPPPAFPKQPAGEVRNQVIDWVNALLASESQKRAGDPGVVLPRRLSNAEYNYTIRDLTGHDLQPTREFPVDPANPAGFDNSGETLAMSGPLLNKYLQAARDVADHMALTPDGIDWAAHPMLVETDRDKYAIGRILDFYKSQATDYADYFEACWRYKHRAALGHRNATLATIAAEAKLSPKYLPMVWQLLEPEPGRREVGPIARLQAMWRDLPGPKSDPESAALRRAACIGMRNFVQRIRRDTAMQFASPIVRGLPGASQPLINWKMRTFSLHHRDSDPNALRNDTDPAEAPPEIPKYPGLHQDAAPRWAAIMRNWQLADPDLVVPAAERERYQASFQRLASVFPDVFYVSERGRYWPDDSEDRGRFLSAGYHNVMGYYRDDTALMELILDEKGQKQLNRLWDEFDFIANHTERTWVQYYFNQSGEVYGKGAESGNARPSDKEVSTPEVIFGLRDLYVAKAQKDGTPEAVEAVRYHFQWENDTLRRIEKMRLDAEPYHLSALAKLAERAYRRPLSSAEREDIVAYYRGLRDKSGLTHEEAIRESIVTVLMAPDFMFRLDLFDPRGGQLSKTASPVTGRPLSPYALASRLSYFLWASMPDQELLERAAAGDLTKPAALLTQVRRMLKNERARDLATEFGGNWLEFRRFEQHNAVDRERFPSFDNELREAMFQEPVRLLEDVIRNDRSVLDLVFGGYTFVNPALARHYGMPGAGGGPENWVRVDDAAKYHRGGLLPMGVFLTQNSPGLRTSPVKRGYWVVRRVLGETIPPPPPVVPELPDDEAKADLPLREMLAKHRENPVCSGCHSRFDVFGLAFENYGPVGEARSVDLAGRPVDTKAALPGGVEADGLDGVLAYIRARRQKDYIDNLSRKLLSYALSRSLLLSDEPLIEKMEAKLAADGYRFSSLVETVVTSTQFLNRQNAEISEKRHNTERKGG